MSIDILAFGAHPDDVEISCGGTLLRYASAGKKIVIVDLTQGELGTRGNASLRRKESEAASKKIGLSTRVNLEMPDCFFEQNEHNLIEIIKQIRQFRPEIILANSITDRHPDHGRAAELVARAAFLSGLPKIDSIFEGKKQVPFRARLLLHYIQDQYITPDIVIDVTPFAEDKMKLVQCFASQFYDPESTEPETPISQANFFDFMKGRMRQFGRPIGVEFAEGFTTSRLIGVNSLFDLI